MINRIDIQGLKSIDNLVIDLKNFNLFLGVNSSGKSTIIQGLLAISQNINQQECKLNGSLVSLGEFREVRNFNTNAKNISIKVIDDMEQHSIEFFEQDGSVESIIDIKKDKCEFKFDEGLYYLSASRIGHLDTYEKNIKEVYKFGLQGEYCFSYFLKSKINILDSELLKDTVSETLEYNVNRWFEYIVGGKLVVNDIPQTDRIKAQFKGTSDREVRTKNIGSGLSYLISIIIMCLSLEKGETIIIENPEIHLHPKAQSRLTEFFMFIANAGRQLIIETHSDHIFNGTRVAISNENINQESVSINFLSLDEKYCTQNNLIEVGKRGRIINPPKDLFDQFDIDLDKMLGL